MSETLVGGDSTAPLARPEPIRILVVDNLPENLLTYRAILEELGESLVTVSSGEEALQEVLREDFAVILLDVNMPGMDGLETASLIRRRRKSSLTPIIFITAFADEVRTAQGYAYGAVDFIMSPVIPEILRAKIKVFVELFRMRQRVAREAEQQVALARQRVALAEERSRREMAEETNRSLAFLARSGDVLGRSLDFDTTLADIAGLPVPQLADRGTVVLRDPQESAWRWVEARTGWQAEIHQAALKRDTLPDDLADVVARVMETGTCEEITLAGSHGLVFPLSVHANPFGALVVSRDPARPAFTPSERSMLENLASRSSMALENASLHRELQHADRHKSEFLATLSHELRNPLAPVRSAIEILNHEATTPDRQRWARDVIDRQMRQMTRLIDDLLDMSRITRNQLELRKEPVLLAEVLLSAIETSRPLIEERRHEFEVSVPSEPIRLDADLTRLSQAVLNLLNNAAKYTEEGGRIRLTAERNDGEVVISVQDTGIGIPPEHLPQIFEMFTQVDRSRERSQGGLGIGLTLVKRLVEMHGGSITVWSAGPGQGSDFTMRLPVANHTASHGPGFVTYHATDPRGGAAGASTPLRIVVADDNHDTAESLGILLESMGHQVRVAFDGQQAVDAAADFHPDVVLLDIGMQGMNGLDACRRIRERHAAEPILLVAVTGWGQDHDRRRTREAGFDHHVVKPVDPAWLEKTLASLQASR